MPFSGNPATSAIDRVRLMTGDILPDKDFLTDETYQYVIDRNSGSEKQAAIEAARYILFALTPNARERAGDIEYYGSEFYKNYKESLLLLIQNPHMGFINAMPFAGGLSRAEIEQHRNNPDNPKPAFYDRAPEYIRSIYDKYYYCTT